MLLAPTQKPFICKSKVRLFPIQYHVWYQLFDQSGKSSTILFTDSSDVCTNHRSLDDDSRLSNTLTSTLIQDDTNLIENDWYVFRGTGGYYRIPNKCLPQNRCGAVATGYMQGTFPTLDDGIVKRKLCFHANGNCCQFSTYIYVRNCYSSYVYKLKKLTASWSARHCVEHYHNGKPAES